MITITEVNPKMIANNLEPAFPTHPGEVLKDEIEYRGIPQRKLAEQIGIGYSVLNEILNARRSVTEKTAMLFEAALGGKCGNIDAATDEVQHASGTKRQDIHAAPG